MQSTRNSTLEETPFKKAAISISHRQYEPVQTDSSLSFQWILFYLLKCHQKLETTVLETYDSATDISHSGNKLLLNKHPQCAQDHFDNASNIIKYLTNVNLYLSLFAVAVIYLSCERTHEVNIFANV